MWPVLAFGAVAIRCGLWLLTHGLRGWYRARAITRWPSTEGRVTGSRIASGPNDVALAQAAAFTPLVGYEYIVDGHRYRSKRIAYPDVSCRSAAEAGSIIARFPPTGAPVTVRYSPRDPAVATLEIAVRRGPIVGLRALACGLIAYGTYFIAFALS